MDDVHVSTLRLVPYRLPPPQVDEYFWFNSGWFWHVYVDEILITELAVPFLASDPVITLWIDVPRPDWWRYNSISVRQLGKYVLWIDELEKELGFWIRGSKPLSGRAFYFDVETYTNTVQQTPGEFQSHPFFTRSQSPLEQALPRLLPRDLRQILTLPDSSYAIYRLPESLDDERGAEILRRVTKVIEYEELDRICLSEPPPHYTELRIGFDDPPDFYESVWHIGRTEQGVAIRFVERPHFPLWLCGAAFDKALGAEPFLQP